MAGGGGDGGDGGGGSVLGPWRRSRRSGRWQWRARERLRRRADQETQGLFSFSVAAATAAAPRCNPVLKSTAPCCILLPLRRLVAIAGAASSPLPLTRHRYVLMPLSSWLQLKQQIQAPVSAASAQSSTEGPKSQQVESITLATNS